MSTPEGKRRVRAADLRRLTMLRNMAARTNVQIETVRRWAVIDNGPR